MRRTSVNIFVFLLVFLSAVVGVAQQQINPNTQINWPRATGSGAPTLSCGSGVNLGLPYFDTVGLVGYTCGPSGWVINSGAGSVTLSNGLVVGTGSGGTNRAASAADLAAINYAVDSGAVNAYVVTLAPVPASLVANMTVNFLAANANTTTNPTINVNGLGVKTITKNGTLPLSAGDITTTAIANVKYDGTRFQLQNPQTSSSPPATASPQAGVYYTNGSNTIVPTTYGPDLLPVQGAILDSTGGKSCSYGELHFGDSITVGVGATATANSYASLLDQQTNCGVVPSVATTAVAGDRMSDNIVRMLNAVSPTTTGNAIFTAMASTNDIGAGTAAANLTAFTQYQLGMDYWLGTPNTNRVLVNDASVTQAGGTWNADTTFAQANGLSTITGGTLTLGTCNVGPSGVVTVWGYAYTASTGTWKFSLDGVDKTDSITGLINISSQIQANGPSNVSSPVAVLARYSGISQGVHSCVITATASTSNPTSLIAFGFPAAIKNRGNSAPGIFRGGTPYEQNDANSAASAAYNAQIQANTIVAVNDGIMDKFVNIRAYLDYRLDFASSATQNCPASTNAPLHPNDCGHLHIFQAFADAMKVGSIVPVNTNAPASNTFWRWNPNNKLGSTSSLVYGESLYDNANGVMFNTWLNMSNNANGGAGYAANFFANAFVAGASGFTDGVAFCTSATFPTTRGDQITCNLHVASGALINTPNSLAIVSSNTSPTANTSIGSGWNGASAANEIYSYGTLFTSAGATGDAWYQIKNSTAVTTGHKGLQLVNASNFGVQIQVDGATVLSRGYLGFGLSIPNAAASCVAGTNVTSCTGSGTNTRGEFTVVGGTATTGTIATINFSAALAAAPFCTVIQNGGATLFNLGQGTPSTTAFTVTAGVTVSGSTLVFDYSCRP